MKATEYRKICDRPDVLSSHILERTLLALRKAGCKEAKILEEVISHEPIPFPEKYSGNTEQCYFIVDCTELQAKEITDILFDLEASSASIDGVVTNETYNYVELVNVWSDLTEYVGKNE